MKSNIVLIGFMATGKSTVGRHLAAKLNMDFIDTDQMIEQIQGKSVDAIFREQGEIFFRDEESNAVALAAKKSGQVIATGGGAVLRPVNYDVLAENGYIVCLKAAPEIITERSGGEERPLLADKVDRLDKIKKLLEERAACYGKADFSVDTGSGNIGQIVEQIEDFLTEHNFAGGKNE